MKGSPKKFGRELAAGRPDAKPRPQTCVRIAVAGTGLDRDSVAQTTLILAIDKAHLVERVGRIGDRQLKAVFARLEVTLGRPVG